MFDLRPHYLRTFRPREESRALDTECGVAEAAAIHFRRPANQARFVLARQAIAAARTSAETSPYRAELDRILKNEIQLARRLHQIQSGDSRVGFEASNRYYYVPADLMEKVLNCRDLLSRYRAGSSSSEW